MLHAFFQIYGYDWSAGKCDGHCEGSHGRFWQACGQAIERITSSKINKLGTGIAGLCLELDRELHMAINVLIDDKKLPNPAELCRLGLDMLKIQNNLKNEAPYHRAKLQSHLNSETSCCGDYTLARRWRLSEKNVCPRSHWVMDGTDRTLMGDHGPRDLVEERKGSMKHENDYECGRYITKLDSGEEGETQEDTQPQRKPEEMLEHICSIGNRALGAIGRLGRQVGKPRAPFSFQLSRRGDWYVCSPVRPKALSRRLKRA